MKRTRRRHTPELEQQLCGIWEELLGVERVGILDNFFELGGHSLLAVRLFAKVQKQIGPKMAVVAIFQAPTVEQLAKAISAEKTVSSDSALVPIQPEGGRSPLFLVHGAGGGVLWGYANLARYFNPDQPIYGIQALATDDPERFGTLEEMAAYYVDELRAFQPHGPYYLGGYCFGGNVAYEMARQLLAQGESLAFLAMLDSAPSNCGYETVA